jgi:hypothetical protein
LRAIVPHQSANGFHFWHSATVSDVNGGPVRMRITASDVEQKLFIPAASLKGVATAR